MGKPAQADLLEQQVWCRQVRKQSGYIGARLGVLASMFRRLVARKSPVTPDMALLLAKVLGRSPQSWLALQDSYAL